jgi:hypothetical protein
MAASTQLDRTFATNVQPASFATRRGMIGKTAAILEKLEEAP